MWVTPRHQLLIRGDRWGRDMVRENLDLRELDSVRFFPPRVRREFVAFIRKQLGVLGLLSGYKQSEKAYLLAELVVSIVLAGRRGYTIADSRDGTNSDTAWRARLWDTLETSRLVRKCTGSELTKKVTRYYATDRLHELSIAWETGNMLNLELHRNPFAAGIANRFRQDRSYATAGFNPIFGGRVYPITDT